MAIKWRPANGGVKSSEGAIGKKWNPVLRPI
jgi:hypothetical protein